MGNFWATRAAKNLSYYLYTTTLPYKPQKVQHEWLNVRTVRGKCSGLACFGSIRKRIEMEIYRESRRPEGSLRIFGGISKALF